MSRGRLTCCKVGVTGCNFAFKVEGWFRSTDDLSLDGPEGNVEQHVVSTCDGGVMYAASVYITRDDHNHGPHGLGLRCVGMTELLKGAFFV